MSLNRAAETRRADGPAICSSARLPYEVNDAKKKS
jgi:hypothetical protein